jgi:Skp family chaperone for outer membrane proteins
MKIVRTTILTLTLLAALTLPALAQLKVATVDESKVFHTYYKTKLATDALDKKKAELTKDLKDMEAGLEKAETDYKQASQQANDPAVSEDERAKRNSALADQRKDIQERSNTMDSYKRQAQAQLGEQSQRMTSNLLGEIKKAVADRAKAGGYTLVLNSTAEETVIYCAPDGANDLTDAVIRQLNAGAPDLGAPSPTPTK